MDSSKLYAWLQKLGIKQLQEANGNIRGCCPYHSERTPSWGISTSEPHYHGCFACPAKGTLYNLLIQVGGYSPKKAKTICLIHETEFNLPEFSAKEEQYSLDQVDRTLLYPFTLRKTARTYLESRGISYETQKAARIVYDQLEARILFPWYFAKSLVGVTARSIDPRIAQELKSEPIWGTKKKGILYIPARRIKKGRLVVVEGEIDALSVYEIGQTNVCAIGRGRLSRDQVRVILESPCSEVCIFTDDDSTGQSLAFELEKAIGFSKTLSRVSYARFRARYRHTKMDPASLTKRDRTLALKGADPHAKFVRLVPKTGKPSAEEHPDWISF